MRAALDPSTSTIRSPTLSVVADNPHPVVLQAMADAIYDLRDHSYDHPESWENVNVVSAFEVMGHIIDRAIETGEDMDWSSFPRLVQDALLSPGCGEI